MKQFLGGGGRDFSGPYKSEGIVGEEFKTWL